MSQQFVEVAGVRVPRFLYGTAWKEEATQPLVELALERGFRGIDTANQRRHYHEAAVGQAIQAAIARGAVTREELFVQTKFTFRPAQDHRLPYEANAPIATQVAQSVASSREHLGLDVLDALLLHGPMARGRLSPADWQAWRAMEGLCESGQARLIGVSNFSLEQLEELTQQARVRPRLVQNRCFATTGWERAVRALCNAEGIGYQGFSLLTANRAVLAHPALSAIARRHGRSEAQIVFRFALEVGMVPLTGTTSEQHMRADLEAFEFELDPDEVDRIERLAIR